MQFGFKLRRETTDAIFNLRELQDKYLLKKKDFYLIFVDLEKIFDRVPNEFRCGRVVGRDCTVNVYWIELE